MNRVISFSDSLFMSSLVMFSEMFDVYAASWLDLTIHFNPSLLIPNAVMSPYPRETE